MVQFDGAQDIAVAKHDPFGQAGGAGGVAQHGDVVGLTQGDLGLEAARLGRHQLAAQRLHVGEGHQPRVVVVPQAAVVPIDDATHAGDALADLQQLIALLLIFGQNEGGVAVVDDVGHLGRGGVGEQANLGRAGGLQAEVGPQILAVVVADGANLVAPPHAQGDEAHGKIAYLVVGISPGELAPDAELLLPQGNLAGRLGLRLVQEKLREGLGRGFHNYELRIRN